MKPILTIVAVLTLAVAGPACGEDKKGGGESSAGPAEKPVDPPAAAPTPEPEPEPAAEQEAAVPTAEDFEEDAEKEITEDGLETEVKKLEAEVQAP